MSKRPNEEPEQDSKKFKSEDSKNLAIDSELIAHQSSYETNKKSQPAANYQSESHLQPQSHENETSSNVSSVVAAALGKPVTTTMSIQPTTLPPLPSDKPAPGSEEWHKLRRENHKEVEKRRRENINTGIRELAGLIPTSDTNKAQILQRAVEYIKRLKENETNNIEKWTLEKLLTEQAVSELDASNTKLKQELERAYREIEHFKRIAEKKE